jgi:hypothetical protein
MYYLNAPQLRSRLKLKNYQSENLLKARHPDAVALLEAAGVCIGSIRQHAAKLLASGATASILLIAPTPSLAIPPPLSTMSSTSLISWDNQSLIQSKLRTILPKSVEPLTSGQEFQLTAIFQEVYGVHAVAELDGNHLNTTYGYIGLEQHLTRYPGDTVNLHDSFPENGMTPGRGAWGYFVDSKDLLTPQVVISEKYYVAVQTLYLPDWTTRLAYLRDWYRYRKVLVVNPHNGKAIVADIADSGPAAWTGKHFGGSPEVMHYLQRQDGRAKGPVVLFFLDDPENRVPLGPLEYNLKT